MIDLLERPKLKAPDTYQEWLDCLDCLKNPNEQVVESYEAMIKGSFHGTEITINALQKQIVDSVNALLDNSVKRFIKNMNEYIAFNELSQIELLFTRLKKDVRISLFFEKLEFLPKKFREELSMSIKQQMNKFWDETNSFLLEQSLECKNADLEDALFLIRRIKLFD